MTPYVLRRLVVSLVLLWIVLTATFAVLHLAPGDPIQRFVDPRVPPAQLDHLRSLYGLDESLPEQYGAWLGAWLRGDWGLSFNYQQPVRTVIARRIGPTVLLGASALTVQLAVGVAFGFAAARKPGSGRDHLLRAVALGLYSMPSFWLAVMLLLVFGAVLGWLPTSGMTAPLADDWSSARRLLDLGRHLILPALALGLPMAAPVARILRSKLLEEQNKEYVIAARARGLRESSVQLRMLRNAAAPLVQIFGLSLPLLLGGSVVIETVFSWPGIGSATYGAIEARDYPLALGLTAFTAGLVVLGNLIADALLVLIDPRVATLR